MKEILGHGPGTAWKYRLDGTGTVIFSLSSGGIICDSGTAIHFRSGGDDQTKAVAEKLAQARWGKAVNLIGQTLKAKLTVAVEQRRELWLVYGQGL
jgi:hypothetical protein